MLCETPSSVLRDWTEDDAPFLARHADNPSIAGHMRDAFPRPYTIKDAEAYIAMATHNRSALLLAIEVDGEAVGGCRHSPPLRCLSQDRRDRLLVIGGGLGDRDRCSTGDRPACLRPLPDHSFRQGSSRTTRHQCGYWRSAASTSKQSTGRRSRRTAASWMGTSMLL